MPTLPVTPTILPSPTISSESAALQRKETKVQILNGSRIPGQAEKERQELSDLGYETIKTGNAETTATTKKLVIFVEKVPEFIRDDIITELKKTYKEVSTQETEEAEYDVIITLGNLIATTPTVSP